jgi:serine phosphatase RsbU (regulator of sigma subunit)
MNRRIKKALKLDKDGAFADDGLDMAVCILNPEKKKLAYAGARIDLRYAVRGEIHTIKGDRRSLGYISLGGEFDFDYTVHHLSVDQRTIVYLATDGITDQPGDKTRQRFGSNRLNEALIEYSMLPLARQYEHLKKTILTYRGERDQVDDMTMVAFVTEF